MKSARILVVILLLQVVTVLALLTDGPRISTAAAQIPDSGALRLQAVEELRALNSRMDRLISMLESGQVQVRVRSDDDTKGGTR